MKRITYIPIASILTISLFITSCSEPITTDSFSTSLTDIVYDPVEFTPNLPSSFPILEVPEDNPLTVDGIKLGQHLFFDPVLSADSTMSCASCHLPEAGFTDQLAVSTGIDGIAGTRSSMSLVNIGFAYTGLFWDGSVQTLEEQALLPVEDPIELHNSWMNVIPKLGSLPLYQELFRKAFGIESTSEISKELAAKAIAQYERVLISGNSKYDKEERGEYFYSEEENEGFVMFFDEDPDILDAECFHCHSAPLLTDNSFRNNGLDAVSDLADFADLGRGGFNEISLDNGKFRVPTLRNIALTAPYMHDGRFQTLNEVLDHYSMGGHFSPNRDPEMVKLDLTEDQKQNLIAFLHTLTDTSYLSLEYIQNPFN